MKKFLIVILLATTLLPLLASPAHASTIFVYAPTNYAGGFSNVTPFTMWGCVVVPPWPGNYLTSSTGYTALNPKPTVLAAFAKSWFSTNWTQYVGPTQPGSVTSDTWLNYSITGFGAGVYAFLQLDEMTLGSNGAVLTSQHRTKTASDGLPGSRYNTFNLGIIGNDLSNLLQPFYWTQNRYYKATVTLEALRVFPGSAVSSFGKFDDLLYIGYTNSPGDDWITPQPPFPSISLSPPIGPVGTNVAVNGTGFQPNENVTLFWDSLPVNQTLTDGSGMFMASFNVPPSTHGIHAIEANGTGVNDTATSFFDVFVEAAPLVGDVNGDGKIDGKDMVLVALHFGQTDPNKTTLVAAQQAAMGLSAVALVGAVNLGVSRRHKKNRAELA